jgi:hypothetical protein
MTATYFVMTATLPKTLKLVFYHLSPRAWRRPGHHALGVRVTLCVLAPTEDLRNLINKAAILSKTRAVTRGLTPVPLLYEGLDPGAFTNKHSVQVA